VGFGVGEPQEPTTARLSWGVAALLLAAGDTLAARFGAVAVRGELSGFSRAASGHCYFNLKDADGAPALIRCAMFRRAATLLAFAPADGQQVEVRGRLAIYDARGELQMVAESMQRLGAGALYEEFLRRRARLEALGLFDAARKRELPPYPRAIGVVTSLGAAALRDVLAALQGRTPHVAVVVVPSLVQGSEAPGSLVQALQTASRLPGLDLLLLVRGGGSLEDLWAFNDERVVHAIAASPLPVVCGVGHETDVTLADLAADLRAPTPTAAAELAATPRDELLAAVQSDEARLARAVERRIQNQAQRLDTLALRLGQPARRVQAETQGLQDRAGRVHRALHRALQSRAERLETLVQRVQAQDPRAVLRRGYAWVESADGRPVLSARALIAGQPITAVWADGRVGATVVTVTSPAKPEPLLPPR
jgi:exodeoxyribonuclease VII large subunit